VIPIVLVVLLATALIVYFQVTRQKSDAVWQVKKEEIIWPDPQQIIGSGTFGLVLLAEYRGTQVAVKRVLPPNLKSKKSMGIASGDKYGEIGTKSWGAMSISGTSSGNGSVIGSETGSETGILPAASNHAKKAISGKKMHRALRDDFMKEMRHLSKLRHPCIVSTNYRTWAVGNV
jgi:serine/threonine protein kinase